MNDKGEPAIVLFVYNRPAVTARVFDAIRRARPQRLFVFADGVDPHRAEDTGRVEAARLVTTAVDWPCEVHRDEASVHLGIKPRVESGLDRVFDEVESAIVLEDDCLPDPTFFGFATELLQRYRDDARIMSVCGSRRTPEAPSDCSYVFSRYPFLWGWATWRRAWRLYDGRMQSWERLRDAPWLNDMLHDRHATAYWRYTFDGTWSAPETGDWDVAWQYTSWVHEGLFVVPATNLVTNLGFGADATHTRDGRHPSAALPLRPMTFPLRHPDSVSPSIAEERLAASHVFSGNLERLMCEVRRRIQAVR